MNRGNGLAIAVLLCHWLLAAPALAEGTCLSPIPIACGDVVQGQTSEGASNLAGYSCTSVNTAGPEQVFVLAPQGPDTLQIHLSYNNSQANLRVMVLPDSCTPDECAWAGTSTPGIPVKGGEPLYLVVDGMTVGAGDFTLHVECQSQVEEGCWADVGAGCDGCPCEACTCSQMPTCCTEMWDYQCVKTCQEECGGCGAMPGCGDGTCAGMETCDNCPSDCGCPEDEVCHEGACCVPGCTGKECGDDGCGGECGPCGMGSHCVAGGCEEWLCPSVEDVSCGESVELVMPGAEGTWDEYGCGLGTPTGSEHFISVSVAETTVATLSIEGHSFDAALALMGTVCDPVSNCIAASDHPGKGVSESVVAKLEGGTDYTLAVDNHSWFEGGSYTVTMDCCQSDCFGKECGDDGCGLSCGVCPEEEVCSPEGACISHPGCVAPQPIACGETAWGENGTLPDLISAYGCPGFTGDGGEVIYTFEPGINDIVTFELTEQAQQQSHFMVLLDTLCAGSACVEAGSAELTAPVVAGTTYFLVVDGEASASGSFSLAMECQSTCVPACQGKNCGPDGCGGSCGQCDGVCLDGVCQVGAGCSSQLEPGCGGCLCEACVCSILPDCCLDEWADYCVGICLEQCEGCGTLDDCGDGSCDLPENCLNCPQDCGCVPPAICLEGTCCQPDCAGKECGSNGCGGDCGACPPETYCWDDSVCLPFVCPTSGILACGDSVDEHLAPGTDGLLTSYSCSATPYPGPEMLWELLVPPGATVTVLLETEFDAALVLMQQGCNPETDCLLLADALEGPGQEVLLFPNGSSDPRIIGFETAGVAQGDAALEVLCCIPDCSGKVCGNDGCSGSCGECPEGYECTTGQCTEVCIPECSGLACGDDGCGGTCGSCEPGFGCVDGLCEELPCEPDCTGKKCGDDGCGGDCGNCKQGFTCTDGQCTCVPQCLETQECGPDGCGGSCGECPDGQLCGGDLQCVCAPECDGRECGEDGCGGSCGECPFGFACQDGLCADECQEDCSQVECGPGPLCGKLCGTCPEGVPCVGGKCSGQPAPDVVDGETEEPKGDGGGCTAVGARDSATAWPLLILVLLVLGALHAPMRSRSGRSTSALQVPKGVRK